MKRLISLLFTILILFTAIACDESTYSTDESAEIRVTSTEEGGNVGEVEEKTSTTTTAKKTTTTTKKATTTTTTKKVTTTTTKAPAPVAQTVYVTETGKKYHSTEHCTGLNNAKAIYPSTLSAAQNRGLAPCSKCY